MVPPKIPCMPLLVVSPDRLGMHACVCRDLHACLQLDVMLGFDHEHAPLPHLLALLAALGLSSLEVAVSELAQVQLGQLHLGGGGQHVGLVHPAHGHAVQLERPADEQQAGGQLAEEHHTSALEAARQQDEHGAGGDALTQLGGLAHDAVAEGLGHLLGGVEAWGLAWCGGRLLRLLVHGELALVLLLQGKQSCNCRVQRESMVCMLGHQLSEQKHICHIARFVRWCAQ
eukprot:358778-Pelagomonas_calceolata.AAC.2